jgi:hypothetical protein
MEIAGQRPRRHRRACRPAGPAPPRTLATWAGWIEPVGRLSFPTSRVVSALDRHPRSQLRPSRPPRSDRSRHRTSNRGPDASLRRPVPIRGRLCQLFVPEPTVPGSLFRLIESAKDLPNGTANYLWENPPSSAGNLSECRVARRIIRQLPLGVTIGVVVAVWSPFMWSGLELPAGWPAPWCRACQNWALSSLISWTRSWIWA